MVQNHTETQAIKKIYQGYVHEKVEFDSRDLGAKIFLFRRGCLRHDAKNEHIRPLFYNCGNLPESDNEPCSLAMTDRSLVASRRQE